MLFTGGYEEITILLVSGCFATTVISHWASMVTALTTKLDGELWHE